MMYSTNEQTNTSEPKILAQVADNSTSKTDENKKEFSVIWHNLTYKADSRPWYLKAKERFFARDPVASIEDGTVPPAAGYNRPRTMEKTILNQLCGEAKSRQLTAIMGPSGAGKSSLLHCLFQNRIHGTSGKILVDGTYKSKLKVCFIPQKDYLNEWLTVREDLIFVSKLKLAQVDQLFSKDSGTESSSSDISSSESTTYVKQVGKRCSTSLIDHDANAHRVAELLGLNNCLDVPIKRISGGQKKRLSIARELMSKPDILVLDEPTTGLDSVTCLKTVMVLRDLAHLSPHPMAVIVTIHQPQREVFELFDKTYFISNKGSSIFEDNPRRGAEVIENVAKLKLPSPNYNPASFLIELASDDSRTNVKNVLSLHQRQKFFDKYDPVYLARLIRSKSANQNWKLCSLEEQNSRSSVVTGTEISTSEVFGTDTLNQGIEDTNAKRLDNNLFVYPSQASDHYYISHQLSDCLSSHSNNFMQSFRHIFILTHRAWLSVIRNPTFTRSRLVFHTMLPLLMLMVFGTHHGGTNNCPKIESELTAQDMSKSLKSGFISQNVEDSRLTMENVSFYFILLYGFGINLISCTASFYPLTMQMFKKESINGLYSPAPYFIGQMLAELPLEVFFPTISILLSYTLSGQIPSFLQWRMFTIAFVVFLVSYTIHSLGLLSGSIFVNDISLAVISGQIALLPFVMLSGFLIRVSRMSDWMRRLSVISPFKSGITGIIAARYGFNACDCDEDMLSSEGDPIGMASMAPNVKHVIDYLFPKNESSDELPVNELFDELGKKFVKSQTFGIEYKSCKDVKPYLMHVYRVNDEDLYYSIGTLLMIIVVFKVITYFIMRSFPYRIN